MGPDQDPRDVKRVTGAYSQLFNLGRCVPSNVTTRSGDQVYACIEPGTLGMIGDRSQPGLFEVVLVGQVVVEEVGAPCDLHRWCETFQGHQLRKWHATAAALTRSPAVRAFAYNPYERTAGL
eukprot:3615796-Prymnesium_polylepis.1